MTQQMLMGYILSDKVSVVHAIAWPTSELVGLGCWPFPSRLWQDLTSAVILYILYIVVVQLLLYSFNFVCSLGKNAGEM